MLRFRDLLFRHALRVTLLLTGASAFLAAPPAFSAGLPGSGLWPRVVGIGLVVSALLLPREKNARPILTADARRDARNLALSCLLWTVLVPSVGWTAATLLTGTLACRSGGCSLKESLILSLSLSASLWFGMERLLHWPLPKGALFSLLSGV